MKHWKAILFIVLLIALVVVAVLGWHWEETADKKFWYTMWPYFATAAAIGFVGLIYWFGKTRNKW